MDATTSYPAYPDFLENYWLERACQQMRTRDEKAALQRLLPSVLEMSNRFTSERSDGFGDYQEDDRLRTAYGNYLFPQTFHRTRHVLEEVFPQGAPLPENILDVGCGSGAATASLLCWMQERGFFMPANILATDRSRDALNSFDHLLRSLQPHWPKARWSTSAKSAPEAAGKQKFDLIFFSFSLGEICFGQDAAAAAELLESCRSLLNPNGRILILEPALKETTNRLMAVRDLLSQGDWRILGPCPHQQACPMRAEGKYWCHEVRTWRPPVPVQRLAGMLQRPIGELKFSFLALEAESVPAAASDWSRLIAPLAKQKGRMITRTCSPEGTLQELELLTRHLTGEDRRRLRGIERGDRVRILEKTPLRGENSYRLPSADALQSLED